MGHWGSQQQDGALVAAVIVVSRVETLARPVVRLAAAPVLEVVGRIVVPDERRAVAASLRVAVVEADPGMVGWMFFHARARFRTRFKRTLERWTLECMDCEEL